jgi:hypothetical protein
LNFFLSCLFRNSFAKQRPEFVALALPYLSRKLLSDVLTLCKLSLHFVPSGFHYPKDQSLKFFQVGVADREVDTESVP